MQPTTALMSKQGVNILTKEETKNSLTQGMNGMGTTKMSQHRKSTAA